MSSSSSSASADPASQKRTENSSPCKVSRGEKINSAEMSVTRLVAKRTKVPLHLLFHRSRCCSHIAGARQLAMYLLHVTLGRTMVEVGDFFGRDRTTVSHACGRIEDRRDSPEFDKAVAMLEGDLHRLAANQNSSIEKEDD